MAGVNHTSPSQTYMATACSRTRRKLGVSMTVSAARSTASLRRPSTQPIIEPSTMATKFVNEVTTGHATCHGLLNRSRPQIYARRRFTGRESQCCCAISTATGHGHGIQVHMLQGQLWANLVPTLGVRHQENRHGLAPTKSSGRLRTRYRSACLEKSGSRSTQAHE